MSKKLLSQDVHKPKSSFNKDYNQYIHEKNHYAKLNKITDQSKSVKSLNTKTARKDHQGTHLIEETKDPYNGPNTI